LSDAGFALIFARPAIAGVPQSGEVMKLKFLFLVGFSCLMVVGPCHAKPRHPAAKAVAKQEQSAAQAPAAPPPTLAQMPASVPQVAFQSGELTISAQNSTLGDILKAVRAQTGATIDLPGNAPERVVGTFGPGPARDVLTSLLNGSHFNFLLLGSSTDPNALDHVILIAKSGGSVAKSPPPVEQANAYNQPAYNRPNMVPMAAPGGNTVTVEGQDAQDDGAATDDSADATDETATDDATDDTTTDDQTTDDQAATDDQQQQPQGQQAVKTPEQMLQELQQRQQQMQQGVRPGMPPGFPNPGLTPGGQPGVPTPPQN
jgi:hypothetical protein